MSQSRETFASLKQRFDELYKSKKYDAIANVIDKMARTNIQKGNKEFPECIRKYLSAETDEQKCIDIFLGESRVVEKLVKMQSFNFLIEMLLPYAGDNNDVIGLIKNVIVENKFKLKTVRWEQFLRIKNNQPHQLDAYFLLKLLQGFNAQTSIMSMLRSGSKGAKTNGDDPENIRKFREYCLELEENDFVNILIALQNNEINPDLFHDLLVEKLDGEYSEAERVEMYRTVAKCYQEDDARVDFFIEFLESDINEMCPCANHQGELLREYAKLFDLSEENVAVPLSVSKLLSETDCLFEEQKSKLGSLISKLEKIEMTTEMLEETRNKLETLFSKCHENFDADIFKEIKTYLTSTDPNDIIVLPEAYWYLAKIYQKYPEQIPKSKKRIVDSYFLQARSAFESMFKIGRPMIYRDLGNLYCRGELFDQNDIFARYLFECGYKFDELDAQAMLQLAEMCFFGRGGSEDIALFADLIGVLDELNVMGENPKFLLLMAESVYLDRMGVSPENERAVHKHEKFMKKLFNEVLKYTDDDIEEEALLKKRAELSLQILEANNEEALEGPKKRRKRDDNELDAQELLAQYKQDEDGQMKLLTTLCYELRCGDLGDRKKINLCKQLLSQLHEDFENWQEEDYFLQLENMETEVGYYVDEEPSEDSDEEREDSHAGDDHWLRPKPEFYKPYCRKLKTATMSKLKDMKKQIGNGGIDADKYKKQVEAIKQLHNEKIKFSVGSSKKSEEDFQHLDAVNYFNSQGQMRDALQVVPDTFVVAQTRGLHFFVHKWRRSEKQKLLREATDKDHPRKNKPIYASSVYQFAGVSLQDRQDELAELKLERAARFLSWKMREQMSQAPYNSEDLPEKIQGKANRHFRNRAMQTQQLYTVDYKAFCEEFLPWEQKQKNPAFRNNGIPYVSTADIQSDDSAAYASGSKYYKSYKDFRLRPRYDKNLKATHSHVGVVNLTLHPLVDYLPEEHNHVVSLCAQDEITVPETILAERECSFFSKIKSDRLKHIEIIKFPSFNHERYLKIMLMRYGLDKDLYFAFRNILSGTRPHSYEQRLIVLLLGEHIVAFKTMLLHERAKQIVRKSNDEEDNPTRILVYRNLWGGFSFRPEQEHTVHKKGDRDPLRRRRLQFKQNQKEKNKRVKLEVDREEGEVRYATPMEDMKKI